MPYFSLSTENYFWISPHVVYIPQFILIIYYIASGEASISGVRLEDSIAMSDTWHQPGCLFQNDIAASLLATRITSTVERLR